MVAGRSAGATGSDAVEHEEEKAFLIQLR